MHSMCKAGSADVGCDMSGCNPGCPLCGASACQPPVEPTVQRRVAASPQSRCHHTPIGSRQVASSWGNQPRDRHCTLQPGGGLFHSLPCLLACTPPSLFLGATQLVQLFQRLGSWGVARGCQTSGPHRWLPSTSNGVYLHQQHTTPTQSASGTLGTHLPEGTKLPVRLHNA